MLISLLLIIGALFGVLAFRAVNRIDAHTACTAIALLMVLAHLPVSL